MGVGGAGVVFGLLISRFLAIPFSVDSTMGGRQHVFNSASRMCEFETEKETKSLLNDLVEWDTWSTQCFLDKYLRESRGHRLSSECHWPPLELLLSMLVRLQMPASRHQKHRQDPCVMASIRRE